jgi:CubicO group peptidase (beta-lactamase class C family)
MKHSIYRNEIIRIILLLVLANPALAQQPDSRQLDQLMDAYNKVDKFNGSILVAKQGKILLEKGYGYRDVKLHAVNDASSIYQIYSITKTFTSTVILMLAEQGKLKLDDKLSRYYPDFPKGDSITIENLLTHTSGIYDYTRGNDMKDQSEPNMIKFLASRPLDFSPGTDWSYSNSGYFLLGFIIQKITGMRYEDAVTKMIFQPLKMTHSGFDYKSLVAQHKTVPYEVLTKDTSSTAIIYEAPGPYAAGAIYSTVGDLYLWHKAHQQYKLVSEALMKKAYTSFRNGYGYGWIVNQFDGHDLVSHSGGAAGYRTNFVRIIRDDIVIIMLCNTENCNPELITNNVIKVLYNQPYFIPKEIPVNMSLLETYIGYYQIHELKLNLQVKIELGRLAAQAAGQQPTVLLAERDDYFYSEEANGYLLFKKGENGKVDEMMVEQGGRSLSAKRYTPSWGLTGSATPKGWVDSIPDISLKEDSTRRGYWIVRNITLANGEIKFRFNNDWNYNYGDNSNDGIADELGNNIKVEAGIYDIILDLSNKHKPLYSLKRTSGHKP